MLTTLSYDVVCLCLSYNDNIDNCLFINKKIHKIIKKKYIDQWLIKGKTRINNCNINKIILKNSNNEFIRLFLNYYKYFYPQIFNWYLMKKRKSLLNIGG
jgi:hypothetical protein